MDLTASGWIGAGLLTFAFSALLLHVFTIAITLRKLRGASAAKEVHLVEIPVTVIRPVCGLEEVEKDTLRSTFFLEHAHSDVIFCAASNRDHAIPYIKSLMAEHPNVRATLLVGDEQPTANPKLNNLVKGWDAADTPWVIMADSNVLLPPTYIAEMLAQVSPDVGLVCSPPVGANPENFWGEVECAFLNSYQARWQLSADWAGFAFAQGKSMLWRRCDLEAAGGILALGSEVAEDAAATKIVRKSGRKVRLVDRPFPQLIGKRSLLQVWNRQVRWARLRRATFLPYYVPEVLSGSLIPTLSLFSAALYLNTDPLLAAAAFLTLWFAAEAMLTLAAQWHMSVMTPLAWIVRDVALPCVWIAGFIGNTFSWRGNEMTVREPSIRSV